MPVRLADADVMELPGVPEREPPIFVQPVVPDPRSLRHGQLRPLRPRFVPGVKRGLRSRVPFDPVRTDLVIVGGEGADLTRRSSIVRGGSCLDRQASRV